MMIVDVRKLNAQKKYSGRLEFSFQPNEELLQIPFVKFAEPAKVDVDYELYEDNALEIKGKVVYKLVGLCSRCLQEAVAVIEGEVDALFEERKDAEDYSYANGKVDLTLAIEDAIMQSMPFVLSCGKDCKAIEYRSE